MNSLEEDAMFTENGWAKNLIARRYEAPGGVLELGFDDVVALTQTPEGEERLREVVEAYGTKAGRS